MTSRVILQKLNNQKNSSSGVDTDQQSTPSEVDSDQQSTPSEVDSDPQSSASKSTSDFADQGIPSRTRFEVLIVMLLKIQFF